MIHILKFMWRLVSGEEYYMVGVEVEEQGHLEDNLVETITINQPDCQC